MKSITEKEKNKLLGNALSEFQKQYPSITSANMQTFVIAWKKGLETCCLIQKTKKS